MRVPGAPLHRGVQVLLAGALLAIYLATLAPGLTWANGGSDGGDLIAAAATRGVAHPTGYPVYLLVAQIFQLLPVGSLAFRTNLLSAVVSAVAALIVSETVRRSLRECTEASRLLAGLVAAVCFGLAPLVWSQAVITEVYALHGFFIALLIYLIVVAKPSAWTSLGMGLALGLAGGNHILALLMAPAVLVAVAVKPYSSAGSGADDHRGWQLRWGPLAIALLGLLAGVSCYAILPLRAAGNPAVNWGAPVTTGRLWWLVSGNLYQDSLLPMDLRALWAHLQSSAALILQQIGFAGLILAVVGLVVGFSRSRIQLATLWAAIAFTVFSLQFAVVDFSVHLLPVSLALAIWIGLGVGRISLEASRTSPTTAWLVGVIALAYVLVVGLGHWRQVDASSDTRAEDFGQRLMAQAPLDALIFAEGDRAVFSAWYFHYALRLRPDTVVIASALLPFDWYRESLRGTYPMLEIPVTAPDLWIPAIRHLNPGRASCYASADLPGLRCQQGEG